MGTSRAVLIAVAAGLVLVAYAMYRWRQRRRVRRVEKWVQGYLSDRYGELPSPLHIHCSDDRLWPVLVDFASPRTGVRRRLRFDCPRAGTPLALLSDKEESR